MRDQSEFPVIRVRRTKASPFVLKTWLACAVLLLAIAGCFVPGARGQAFGPGNALNFDGASGYVQAANGVWFSSDFTIEGWVFVRNYNNWSRLLDFADGPSTNNVYLALSYGTTGYPGMGVFTNNNANPVLKASVQLPLNQWVHLAATLSGTTGTIYINGIPAGSGTLNRPPNVVRTNNYIGRSNYSGDQYANAVFDEIRIWNVARSQAQIQSTMHMSIPTNTPGLVGLWQFDEGSGTNTYVQPAGLPSSLAGGVTWTNSGVPFIPYVSAGPASVAGSTATFNGVVNPGNLPTAAWFEWGTTTNYGNTTALTYLPATNASLPINIVVTNYNPAAVYHYAVVATNSAGTNFSADVQIPLGEPIVSTLADDGSPGSIRYVIANMASGGTVTFATNGTITLTNGEIAVTNNLTVAGPGPAYLVISGNFSSRVFNVGSNAVVVINGLTLDNAVAASTLAGDGGGIYNAGTLTLSNCVVNNCTAMPGAAAPPGNTGGQPGPTGGNGGNGGGIYNARTLSLIACTLAGNSAGPGGAGAPGSFSTFASPGQGGNGGVAGAIYSGGNLFLSDCTLSGNSGGAGGPAGTTSDVGFPIQVGAPGNGGDCGAIYNLGTAMLTACTFNNNAGGNGSVPPAPFGASAGPPGNGGDGGAIYNAGEVTLTLCTLDSNAGGTGNVPGTGGGIYNSGQATLMSSTITRNNGGTAGGVYNTYELTALNTLFANNIAASNSPDFNGPFSTQGYNLIGNNSGSYGFFVGNDHDIVGTSNAPVNPLITPLANHGGPTFTVALQAGSPAIDAGDDGLLSQGVTTDQRGFPRKSGAHVDIGAYEVLIGTPPVLTGVVTTNGMFGVAFTNTPHAAFTIISSTNLSLPLIDWTVPGLPTETPPGLFLFLTPTATNSPQQYYTVHSP